MSNPIDVRSDTVTHPTKEMRQAMAEAILGDDVYGDDPTVNEFQEYAAQLLGTEATLFVPSGVFGNQTCIKTHTQPGVELILSESAHIVISETGAAGAISGVQLRPIDVSSSNGILTVQQIDARIRKQVNVNYPRTGLISVEQPTLQGVVYPLETLKAIKELAVANDLKVHMDGARIFNAAAYLKCDVKEITQYCDSGMLCLSKGLCAPVGSLIFGTKEFIEKARHTRKMLGGGLRQVGVLAAAGFLALKEQTKHLTKDKEMAELLAQKLKEIPSIEVTDKEIMINMVHIRINNPAVTSNELIAYLAEKKIKASGCNLSGIYRLMTHFYIREAEVEQIIDTIKSFLSLHSSQ